MQYQSANFPAPFPLSMGRMAERVVDETAPVKLLDPANPLLTSPNAITAADFDGWVEERGHSFLDSWDAGYTPLTETADPGQDPQRGGLLGGASRQGNLYLCRLCALSPVSRVSAGSVPHAGQPAQRKRGSVRSADLRNSSAETIGVWLHSAHQTRGLARLIAFSPRVFGSEHISRTASPR